MDHVSIHITAASASLEMCFGQALPGGDPRTDPKHIGEIKCLGWLGNNLTFSLEELVEAEGIVWISLLRLLLL